MSVLIVCFAAAVAAAVITALLALLWWSSDVGAPQADASAVAATVRRHVVVARWVRNHLNPDVATGTLLGVIAVVVIVGGGLVGVLLEMVRAHRGFADFDTSEPHWSGPAGRTAVEILHLFGPHGDQAIVRTGW